MGFKLRTAGSHRRLSANSLEFEVKKIKHLYLHQGQQFSVTLSKLLNLL